MRRRRHNGEQELPFVALMDTLTNVVGVLTIVLVMIGISMARAVNKVISELPPATQEQVKAAQARLDELRAAGAPAQARLQELKTPDADPARLAAAASELARLETQARAKDIKLFDVAALEKEREKKKSDLAQQKQAAEQALAERDRLKGLLDATPLPRTPPAKVVSIPASRPVPEGADIRYILVNKDGISAVDPEGVKESFLREFTSTMLRRAEVRRVNQGGKLRPVYDSAKVVQYFAQRKMQYRDFDVEVRFVGWTASPVLRLRPRPGAGIDPLQGGRPNPAVRSLFSLLKGRPKAVAMFRVTADGFENYLAAREACDAAGLPAGWEFTSEPVHDISVGEIMTDRKVDPPKPSAPPPIKSPTRTLD
jgi:hypothetical protein